ncbi:RHS repeat-associated core domain-containing protein, partial [Haliangium sp.]|uniref:RHS repeat-associated core domain-containing protein n=1 Tax=Haliangium sp. TaxID=2663208 RepID=UPI003D122558
HGFYDSREKRFRGFERSESRLLSDASQEAGLTVSEYDVGFDDVYFNGRLRSQTVYSGLDEAGAPLQTQRMEYDECPLAEVPTTGLAFPVRSICMTGQTTIVQEGAAEAEWVTLRSEYDYDDYGNATQTRNLGVIHRGPPEAAQSCAPCARDESVFGAACGATCTGDESFTDTEYIAPGAATGGSWILGRAVRERTYGVAGGVAGGETSEVTTYYDGPDFVGLPAGQLDKGLVTRVTTRVRAGSDDTIALVRNRYDQHGNVIETMDPNGSLERANSHRRVREYDRLGLNLRRTEILLEDEDGNPYRLRQELGYEPLFNRISESTATMLVVGGEVKSARNSSFYRYDAFGRLHRLVRPGDSQDAPSLEVSYVLADPATAIISHGRSKVGGDADIESIRCLDGRGRVLQSRTRLADDSYQVTGFTEYNKRGEPVRIFEPYLDSSSACATRPPGDGVRSTQIRYDALARSVETLLPDADLYGEPSRLRTEYAPLATLQYDPEDNDPQSPHFNTPVVNRLDGMGRTVAIERHLDAAGAAPTIELHYDSLGRMRGYRDPAGNLKTQQYDLLGRVLSVDDPNAGVTGYEYDAAGNMTVRRDARGVVTRTRYDGANRPVELWDEGDREGSLVRYRYDRAEVCSDRRCTNVEGKLAEVLYPVELGDGPTIGRDQFGFDVRGRPVYQARILFGHEFVIERSFDNAGRLVRELYPDGQELSRSYDGASRLVGIDGVLDQVAYDERGQLEHVDYGNGTSTWHSYDGVMRLSELVTLGSDGKVLQGFAYERDRAGNIHTIADMATPRPGHIDADASFTYDAWYRLLTAELGGGATGEPEILDYRYDAIDNIMSASSSVDVTSAAHVGEYAYDATRPNAVVQPGGRHRAYDAAGNVLERGGQSLRWDYMGRLTGADDGAGVPVAHFAYSANEERVAKREADTLTLYIAPDFEVRDGISVMYARIGGERVVRLQSDALATALLSDLAPLDGGESRPDGQINAADAWIASLSGETASTGGAAPHSAPDALLRSSARRLLMAADAGPVYLHSDHLGSLTLATSADSGVHGEQLYYPTGQARAASALVDVHGFTGQEVDASTGLTRFQHRYLDSDTGRWLSPDPLFRVASPGLIGKLGDSTSAYAYASGNFPNAVDRTGLDTIVIYVHGTFAAGANAAATATTAEGYAHGGAFRNAVVDYSRAAGGTGPHRYQGFDWNGGQWHADRTAAAAALRQEIQNHLAAGHEVNLVGHSHGGTVIGLALAGLGNNENVNNVMMLGTPHSSARQTGAWSDAAINRVAGTVHNVYSNNDMVAYPTAELSNQVDRNSPLAAKNSGTTFDSRRLVHNRAQNIHRANPAGPENNTHSNLRSIQNIQSVTRQIRGH